MISIPLVLKLLAESTAKCHCVYIYWPGRIYNRVINLHVSVCYIFGLTYININTINDAVTYQQRREVLIITDSMLLHNTVVQMTQDMPLMNTE